MVGRLIIQNHQLVPLKVADAKSSSGTGTMTMTIVYSF